MKSFLPFLLTFVTVYWLAPWLAYQIFGRAFPRYQATAGLAAIWLAYLLLRRLFKHRLPYV